MLSSQRKPIFDAVRRLLRRGLKQGEVDAIDDAIDASIDALCRDAERDHLIVLREIGPDGIALIKRFEGCARLRRDGLFEAYPDPASSLARTGSGSGAPWTIGWGATGSGLNGTVGPATVWGQAECNARIEADLVRYADEVAAAIGDAPTTQTQFDALVSFHYNTGAIARATLTAKHVSGDHAGAVAEFARWNRAGGCVLTGLVRRRAAEAALYAKQLH